MRHPTDLLRSKNGVAIIMVGVALVAIFAFAVLAIDVGTLYVTRSQLGNAADAGALAGAKGMIESTGDSATAVDWAITFAGENQAFIGADETGNVRSNVVITEDDVTFPGDGLIRVSTHRTVATGDPLRTIFLGVIDPTSDGFAGVRAAATASYFYSCGSRCFRPWSPPDRWFDANGNGLYDPSAANPGEYYDPAETGYQVPDDIGAQVIFMLGNGNQDGFGADWYYAVDFPPVNKGNPISGADQYRSWIEGCVDTTVIIEVGDTLRCEPGNMVGPSNQGIDALIALDPDAYFDPSTGEVVSSVVGGSPRVIKLGLFDPAIGRVDITGGRGVVVVKLLGFFLEGRVGGGDIVGRLVQVADPGSIACDDPTDPSFLYAVKLVE
jgi:Flp pilus assembly protein TadG